RSDRDWSSDVCSSDLDVQQTPHRPHILDVHSYRTVGRESKQPQLGRVRDVEVKVVAVEKDRLPRMTVAELQSVGCRASKSREQRSEERRVGKEWRCGW